MELVTVSEQIKNEVRQKYGTDEEKITKDVTIIKEWLAKQPHLPQNMPFDDFIEKMLLSSKFRVEIAKENLDAFFSVKNSTMDFYEIFDSPDSVLPSESSVGFVPLPKLGPERERIVVVWVKDPDPSYYQFKHFLQNCFSLLELLVKYDYSDGFRLLMDLENWGLGHVKKVDLGAFMRFSAAIGAGNHFRLVGVDLIHYKPWQGALINIGKKVAKEKIAKRVVIHPSLESLHEKVSKENLPEELGGELGSRESLIDQMDSLVKQNQQYLTDCRKYASDESLRLGKSKYMVDMYGVDGSFKKLNVD